MRLSRWPGFALLAALVSVVQFAAAGFVLLSSYGAGTPAATAIGRGHDAEWLGHAWVDGRRTQSDVDALAARLRDTGIRDVFVHAGPFRDDGTLDPALRPRGRWFVDALHAELPGIRVQAWLGAHPTPAEMHLGDPAVRRAVVASVASVLDDGFDGVHLDFEPLVDGDDDLIAVLRAAHAVTRARGRILSVSAVHTEPVPGVTTFLDALPGIHASWSAGYLHRVAVEVDQVALMAYDTALFTAASYSGYVRRATEIALAAVPPGVALFIGLPAYHDHRLTHDDGAETVAAAVKGVRLALGGATPTREFGVALYVDFAATAADWSAYRSGWLGR